MITIKTKHSGGIIYRIQAACEISSILVNGQKTDFSESSNPPYSLEVKVPYSDFLNNNLSITVYWLVEGEGEQTLDSYQNNIDDVEFGDLQPYSWRYVNRIVNECTW